MSMGLEWHGLDSLLRQLKNAPTEVRAEATGIVRDTTEAAAADIRSALPSKTGNLLRGVKTFYPSETVIVGIVRNTSPHSHLYEWGTRQRQNASGANRGVMPANPITPAVAQRHRDRMYGRLGEMLKGYGFEVVRE